MDAPEPTEGAYTAYLQRYEEAVGPGDLGSYAKYKGRLIKKLARDEFDKHWKELAELTVVYEKVVEAGDTINDILVRVLRERCDELLVERKV